jgi:hypothetical protein
MGNGEYMMLFKILMSLPIISVGTASILGLFERKKILIKIVTLMAVFLMILIPAYLIVQYNQL